MPKLPESILITLRQLIYININVAINKPVKDRNGEHADQRVIPSMEAAKDALEKLLAAVEILRAEGGKMLVAAPPAASGTAETFLNPEKEKHYQILKREYKLLAAPNVVLEVLEMAQDPDAGLSSMVPVVEKDPAIAARTMQYANSPYSGTRNRFDSLQAAVVHLGFERMIGLAADVSMRGQKTPRCEGFDYDLFWNRSAATAAAARSVAPMFGDEILPVVAFTAGLLSRIGELAYASTFPKEFSEYLRSSTGGPEETHTRTLLTQGQAAINPTKKIALSPVELSARLLADWKMPRYVYCSVLHQDDISFIGGAGKDEHDRESHTMLKILRWASVMAEILTAPPESLERSIKPKSKRLAQQLNAGDAQFAKAFNGSIKNWKIYGRLLNVQTREIKPWPEVLEAGA